VDQLTKCKECRSLFSTIHDKCPVCEAKKKPKEKEVEVKHEILPSRMVLYQYPLLFWPF